MSACGHWYFPATNLKSNVPDLASFSTSRGDRSSCAAVCLVSCTDFQTKAARILITILSLPGVFFILHFFHVGFVQDQLLGPDPTYLGWQLMVLSKIIPLILLTVLVLWSDILLACRDLRRFYKVMRQVNKELEVFG